MKENNMPADKFTRPPSGKEVTGDDIKNIMSTGKPAPGSEQPAPAIEDVASVLGGTVVDKEEQKVSPVEPPVVEGIEVPVEDRREYLRTLLAGEPWTKTYDLFGGSVKVTFNTRTVASNDSINRDMLSEECMALVESHSHGIVRERLRMKKSITEITRGGVVDTVDLDSMNEVMFASLRKAFRHFEATCDVLFMKANDSNFWNETAGAF